MTIKKGFGSSSNLDQPENSRFIRLEMAKEYSQFSKIKFHGFKLEKSFGFIKKGCKIKMNQ